MSQMWECSCGRLVPNGSTCGCKIAGIMATVRGNPDGGEDISFTDPDDNAEVIDDPDEP